MDTLRQLLNVECKYRMNDDTMDTFLDLMTEVHLEPYEALVDYGALDSNIYVIKSGIIRCAYFNGFREMTYAFGAAGTMLTSYYPFLMREPSFCKFEACCPMTVMKISRAHFLELTRQSHDFAQWVMHMSWSQLWLYEMKLSVINGDAKERFRSLMENRPEIVETVPVKYIAAYIGVTPQYLCKMKRIFKSQAEK